MKRGHCRRICGRCRANETFTGRPPKSKPAPPDKICPGNPITKIGGSIPLPLMEDQLAGLL